MEKSISLSWVRKARSAPQVLTTEKAALFCKKHGFARLDYAGPYLEEDWREKAIRERAVFDRLGVRVIQSHAPTLRDGLCAPSEFPELLRRSAETAVILGASFLVVHGDGERPVDHFDPEEEQKKAYELFAPVAGLLAREGRMLAVENLFETPNSKYPKFGGRARYTAFVDEQIGLIERFKAPEAVGACWDSGHGAVTYGREGAGKALKALMPYLCCTHIHDNNKGRDEHLIPFQGEIDWEEQMKILREGAYRGDLSFEFVYGGVPADLMPEWLGFVSRVGDRLIRSFEEGGNG